MASEARWSGAWPAFDIQHRRLTVAHGSERANRLRYTTMQYIAAEHAVRSTDYPVE